VTTSVLRYFGAIQMFDLFFRPWIPKEVPWWRLSVTHAPGDDERHRYRCDLISPPPPQQSWENWFQEHWSRGYRIAFAILRDHDDASEAVNTALLNIEAVPHTPREFDRYLDRAVRRRAYEILFDRASRWSRYESLDGHSGVSSCPNPEQLAIEDQQARLLRAAVATLPPKEQEVIALYHFAGLTAPEIARMGGLDTYTIQNRLYKGRALLRLKLRTSLGRDFELPDRKSMPNAQDVTRVAKRSSTWTN